jgi:hypothetical protein
MSAKQLRLVKARLAACEKQYDKSIEALCAEVRRQVVIPFCDKREWDFHAGNGTWVMGPVYGDAALDNSSDYRDDKEFQDVAAILNEGIPLMNNGVGSYMRDYTPRKK